MFWFLSTLLGQNTQYLKLKERFILVCVLEPFRSQRYTHLMTSRKQSVREGARQWDVFQGHIHSDPSLPAPHRVSVMEPHNTTTCHMHEVGGNIFKLSHKRWWWWKAFVTEQQAKEAAQQTFLLLHVIWSSPNGPGGSKDYSLDAGRGKWEGKYWCFLTNKSNVRPQAQEPVFCFIHPSHCSKHLNNCTYMVPNRSKHCPLKKNKTNQWWNWVKQQLRPQSLFLTVHSRCVLCLLFCFLFCFISNFSTQ